MAIELAKAILRLWSMLGLWVRLIDGVGQAGRFCGCKSLAEAQKLGIGQVPFPSALPILLDALGWVACGVYMPMSAAQLQTAERTASVRFACGRRLDMLAWRPSISAWVTFVRRLVPSWGKMWSRKALS